MNKMIPLSVPNLKGRELKYITKAVEDEWVSTGGGYIDDFENKMAEYLGVKGAVACQSGTAGLHLALICQAVGRNHGVIVPTLTFVAAVNPVKYIGAEPFFMDCDDSLCMDMDKVREFCQDECDFVDGKLIHKKTKIHIKAMIFVHIFGNIGNIEEALALSKEYNFKLIEDATEALGSYLEEGSLKGKYAGTIGDMGVFSFNGNKIITTGGGGMVVSNDEEALANSKYLSTQAKDDSLYYIHKEIGYNYRMTNLQAAMGLGQLEQLEDFIETKTRNYNKYKDLGIKLLPFREDIRSNRWFYSYMTKDRDGLIQFLEESKIQSRPIWELIHELKPYKDSVSYKIEKAPHYLEEIVNIPCSTNLKLDDVICVSKKLLEYEKNLEKN